MGYLNEKLEYFETPEFANIHEKVVYIQREERRINEGFENLSGLHYFHLAKIKIKPLKGPNVPPRYTDTDEKMINDFLWCINYKAEIDKQTGNVRLGWDLDIIKRRRAHFTTLFGGTIPCWISVVDKYKGATYPITSCDEARLNDLIGLKLKPAVYSCVKEGYFPYDHYSNPEFMRFSSIRKQSDNASTIYFLDTSKDDRAAAKAEGTGNIAYLIDERFLHPKEEKVKMSFDATLNDDDGNKIGIGISGGSANAFTKGSTEKLRNLLKACRAEGSNIKLEFIAGWDGLVKNPDGTTNREKGEEKIYLEREKLRKSEQWDKLNNYIKSYPLSIDELISSTESEYFNPSIMQNISKGKMFAFNSDPLECNLLFKNGVIYPDTTQTKEPNLVLPTTASDSTKTKLFPYSIFEKPIPGHTYIAGLDPIDFLGVNPKGSMFSCVVKDITANRYVSSLEFRTTDSELGYNLWYNLMYYYKSSTYPMGALCLAERNRLSSLITTSQAKGTLNLLARDPAKIASGYQFKDEVDRGYHKHSSGTIQMLMGHMKTYLQNNIVPFGSFNEGFTNYDEDSSDKIKKADIIDAVLSCEYLSNYIYRGGNATSEQKYKKVEQEFRNAAGFLDVRIVKVPI